ncbi:MAG: ABC transporter substrate-binding protein [Lachnospiraceae bacterium]|nr:ABC transporter substrate-binding protein [Lachnospiraceae bacterium]
MTKMLGCLFLAASFFFSGCGAANSPSNGAETVLSDGEYELTVSMTGGSGRASVTSPAKVVVTDGDATATIEWGSPHYDYMIIDGTKYFPVNAQGNSVFEIPVPAFDDPFAVIADTTAMSAPHEISYELTIKSPTTATGSGRAAKTTGDGSSSDAVSGNSSTEPKDVSSPANTADGNSSAEATDSSSLASSASNDPSAKKAKKDGSAPVAGAPVIEGLVFEEELPLSYAKEFHICRYEGGYSLIVTGEDKYLLLPEKKVSASSDDRKKAPDISEKKSVSFDTKKLPSDIVALQRPLQNVYLAATAAMSLIDSVNATDAISFSSIRENDWHIPGAKKAMAEGKIIFAGKYSAPDYETLVAAGCPLAIESTMILHSPQVQEKLEGLGLPVFIDRSSYESDPLGRAEWALLYGELFGKEAEAKAFFTAQEQKVNEVTKAAGEKKNCPTVAFFYINSSGNVIVRKTDDYIPKMIEQAGGRYIFENLANPNPDSRSGSVTITKEEFYTAARNADYLIYNASIEATPADVTALVKENALLSDFDAVRSGNVFVIDSDLYQATGAAADIIGELQEMMRGGDSADMRYIKKLPK